MRTTRPESPPNGSRATPQTARDGMRTTPGIALERLAGHAPPPPTKGKPTRPPNDPRAESVNLPRIASERLGLWQSG